MSRSIHIFPVLLIFSICSVIFSEEALIDLKIIVELVRREEENVLDQRLKLLTLREHSVETILPAPIHLATELENDKMILILLKHGFSINAPDAASLFPLDYARSASMTQFLKKHGALYSGKSESVFLAARAGNFFGVKSLYENCKFDIEQQDPFSPHDGLSILHLAAQWNCTEEAKETIEWLINRGAQINIVSLSGFSPVDFSSSRNMGHFLKKHGAKPSGHPNSYWAAWKARDIERCRDLLKESTKLTLENGYGRELLIDACTEQATDIVRSILVLGFNPNYVDINGDRPISIASQYNLSLVKLLVEGGAEINSPDKDGETPLHCAIRSKHPDVVKYLLEKKANINVLNKDGYSPLTYSLVFISDIEDRRRIFDLLIKSGANVNLKGKECDSPLIVACRSAVDLPVIKKLLELGADLDSKSIDGLSPLEICIANGKHEIVKLLGEFIVRKK